MDRSRTAAPPRKRIADRHRFAPLVAATGALVALVAGGCGSGASSVTTASRAGSQQRTRKPIVYQTPTAPHAPTTPGVAHSQATTGRPTAEQVLADAIAAARGVQSYSLRANITDAQGSVAVLTEVNSPSQMLITQTRSSGVTAFVIYGPYTYFKAPGAYWAARPNITPAQAAGLADRWLRFVNADQPQVAASEAKIADVFKDVPQCWSAQKSGLTVTGSSTLNGKPVIAIKDPGIAPGSAPGTVYVSKTDPKLPVMMIITGPPKPGGPPACRNTTTLRSGVLRMTYNQHFQITPPQGATAVR